MRATQRLNVLVAIAALICGIVGVYGQQQDATVQLSIEHAIGGAPFTPRGQVALPQASALYGARTQPRLSQPALSSSDLHALKAPFHSILLIYCCFVY